MPTSTNTLVLLGWWNCLFVSAKQRGKLLMQLLFVPRHCNRAASPTYLVHRGLLKSLSISYWVIKHHQSARCQGLGESSRSSRLIQNEWSPQRSLQQEQGSSSRAPLPYTKSSMEPQLTQWLRRGLTAALQAQPTPKRYRPKPTNK